MSPESIQGLSIPREVVLDVLRGDEVVLDVLRGDERVADVRRLRVRAALAQIEAEKDAA